MNAEMRHAKYMDWGILIFAALLINLITFIFQKVPGYMDAEYYFAGALNLFRGNGFSESYIWNTLSLPPRLPFASHLYWMPLPSIFGSLGLFLSQEESFFFARMPFLLMTVMIPVLTYQFANEIDGRRKVSLIAGLMAVFPGVYLVYLTLVEAFSPYILIGGLIILLIYRVFSTEYEVKKNVLIFVILGIFSAMMHLTRADGILWLGFCGLVPVYWILFKREWKKGLITGVILLFAYSLTMFPWYLRNLQLFQQLFPPGNQYTLFLTEYNDNFLYPVNQITAERWLTSGWMQIIADRAKATGSNLLTAWMIQFEVVLLPFFIVWLKQNWVKAFPRWLMLCYALQFLLMSLVFPYAGMRGGFLHSGSAFQIVFWSASAVGLFATIQWWMKIKSQFDQRIPILLSSGVVFILAVVTLMMYQQKVFGPDLKLNQWQMSKGEYELLNIELESHGIDESYCVMINNPPGFYLVSGKSSIVVPNADIAGVIELAKKYDIDYLVLDTHVVPQLADFYYSNGSVPGAAYLFSSREFKVYAFEAGER